MISSFVRRLFDNLLVPDVPVFCKLMYPDKAYLVVACTLSHFVSSIVLLMASFATFLGFINIPRFHPVTCLCSKAIPCIGLSYLTKFIFLRFKVLGALVSFQFPFVFRNFLAGITAFNRFQDILHNFCRGRCIMCGSRPLS
jgi:hypothetical protein